ncbi:MAG: hybrid sensor histidine kinase/response regulator [Leptolyngbya sp.]|nr:MAG: hybrid sensor histidine kinase/response regulator [Leptolyngbya sp.]
MSKRFQPENSQADARLALTSETPEQQVEECHTLLRQALQELQQAQETVKETRQREQLKRQIASQIRASLDLTAILQGAVTGIRELLQVESCHFIGYHPHAAASGWETIQEAKLPHVPSLGWHSEEDVEPIAEILLNQGVLRVNDVETLDQPKLQTVLRHLGIKSQLVLPIRTHSGVIGALHCTNFSELCLWSDEDVEWLQDILEQLAIAIQQAELAAELRTSKVRLDAFFAGANAGLVIFDRQLRYVHINEALAETNGVPAADHIGKSIREVLPQLASVLEPMFQNILDTGNPILDYELVGETPKQPGVMRYWLASYYPLLDESGTIFGVGGVVIEISDRKNAELALRQSEERLQSILDNSPAVIYTKDTQGRFLTVNRQFESLFRLSKAEVVGKRNCDLFDQELAEAFDANDQKVLATKTAMQWEELAPHDDGLHTYLSLKFPLLDIDGIPYAICGFSTDITDRKQAETALLQLAAIVESSEDAIFSKTLEGSISSWNIGAERLFGYTPAEAIGQHISLLIPSDRLDEELQFLEKLKRGERIESFETLRQRKDGTLVDISLTISPLKDPTGAIVGVSKIARDISKQQTALRVRQQTEEALQDQTCLLNLILNSMGDGIVVANEQGQFMIFNPAAEQMFGNSATDAGVNEWSQHYGLFLSNQVTPFPADELPLARAIQGEEVKDVELFVRHAKAPTGRWVLANARPLRDESGQLQGGVVVCRDVTDRKQAEQALKQSEERYRSLTTATSQIVWMADVEGRVADIPDWRAFTGQTESEVAGFGWLNAIHPDDQEQTGQVWLKAVQTKALYDTEYRIRSADGSYRYFVARGVPVLNQDGSIREWVGTCTDIHDRKQAEMALTQAKEAAEAANRAKSEFLANMSHELRTPLNGVIGYAQILQRANTLSEEDRSRIEVIHQCGSHLLTLINDILDLSKIEAQKVALMPTDFHLPAFLQGVAEMCRIRAELKGIQFQYQSASELPIGIRADEKRLRQVLINLLSNAIKFTDAGSVTFTISFAGEGKIRFEVRDTGIGIRQEKLQAIFQPFEQVSDAQRQSEGTGLGLAISQELVELMGSTIQVQSEVGAGSIFWFDVNLIEAAEWVKTAQANVHGQIIGIKGCRPKILVVDDRWENRSVVSKLLSPIGFDIVEAVSGQEGWQKAVEVQPDLMITDLVMPDVDGFELIDRMRESETFKDLIIVVSSASVFEADQYRSIEAGGNDFLPKPVLAAELLQKLQKHLHLEWIYEEQQLAIDSDVNDAELTAPPPAELETLHKLAMKGNFKGIMKQVALLEQADQKYSPFAKKLHQLAKGFQDEEILAFIRSLAKVAN